jgi:hypothetical protein
MEAPIELTSAITRRMQNSTRIWTLVTRSTLERFRGALVEFWKEHPPHYYILHVELQNTQNDTLTQKKAVEKEHQALLLCRGKVGLIQDYGSS